MQHRYYIGLRLPAPIAQTIQDLQAELFDSQLMQPPLEPHITLLPPPAVERVEPEELARQSHITAEPFWPLALRLTKVEPYKDYAISVAVEGEAIYRLQQALLALLPPDVEAIYYPNPRFSPHVTLTHAIRGKTFPPELTEQYAKRLQDKLPRGFEATELTLFRWAAPATYKALTI